MLIKNPLYFVSGISSYLVSRTEPFPYSTGNRKIDIIYKLDFVYFVLCKIVNVLF